MAYLNTAIFMIFLLIAAAAHAQKSISAFGADVVIPHGCQSKAASRSRGDEYFYCHEKPDNYPHDNVDAYIEDLRKLEHTLVSSEDNDDYDDKPQDSFTRDSSCKNEMHKNCCSESKYETPYLVNSNDDNLKLVIQSKFFQQTIKVTKCADEGVNCFEDLMLSDFGFKANCVTNYGTTKLLVLTSDNVKETVPASYPVSCSCVITKE